MKVSLAALLVCAGVVCRSTVQFAQAQVWQPSEGREQAPIWPGVPPDAQSVAGPEVAITTGKNSLVAGRPWVSVEDVSTPTMTIYLPHGRGTGAAVMVFPGGGYTVLAIDLEGTEVCDWLTSRGVTCILLKYRVPGETLYPKTGPYPKSGPFPESPMALEDAQRAMGLVRLHAAQLDIDPHRIGVLGFSAGGHLVAALSNHFARRLYSLVDAADRESCRPDFAIAIYPGHLSLEAARWDASLISKGASPGLAARVEASRGDPDLSLNPDLHVTAETPPTFLLQAEDDHEDSAYDSMAYAVALRRAGVPFEMHIYAQGGHAFGLRRTQLPITAWPQLVDAWLATIGVLANEPPGD